MEDKGNAGSVKTVCGLCKRLKVVHGKAELLVCKKCDVG